MNKKTRGFTLIELMITIVIVAVLLTIAIPSYNTMILNNCLVSNNSMLVTSLHYARSEAVRRRVDVTVQSLNAADNTNEWGLGWQITEAGGTVLKRVQLTACTNTTIDEAGDVTSFSYESSGVINPSATLTFNVCDSRSGETGNQITVLSTGRPATVSLTCP